MEMTPRKEEGADDCSEGDLGKRERGSTESMKILGGWVCIPNSFVSLFVFYILSYLLLKTMGCLSGCLVSSASLQELFCGICSVFK